MASGTLKVLLKRGVGLKAADLNGKSDPYVVVKCGGLEVKSRVCPKTLDPVWNETLDFKGTLNSFLSTGMLLRCFDKDWVTRDDPLGDAKLSLAELNSKVHHEYEVLLPTQGTLYLSVSWLADTAQQSNTTPHPTNIHQPAHTPRHDTHEPRPSLRLAPLASLSL